LIIIYAKELFETSRSWLIERKKKQFRCVKRGEPALKKNKLGRAAQRVKIKTGLRTQHGQILSNWAKTRKRVIFVKTKS